jgi:hypothetical protein
MRLVGKKRMRLFSGLAPTRFESATNNVPLAYAKPLAPPKRLACAPAIAAVKTFCPMTARAAWPLVNFCPYAAQMGSRVSRKTLRVLK